MCIWGVDKEYGEEVQLSIIVRELVKKNNSV
jgi:hypothetical protein